jgi:hypothetical protein
MCAHFNHIVQLQMHMWTGTCATHPDTCTSSSGTDKESKSPPNGRATGTVRRSIDGGQTWEASVDLNGAEAYSYSCLTRVPQPGYIGLAFETVLPGSTIGRGASANNVVFTLVPQNFSTVGETGVE